MLLCKKIKLNVTEQDAATLEFMQGKCRGLYNWWVMRLRDGEKWPGWRMAKETLQASKQHNSAVNILTRFLARRGPYTSFGACDVL